MNLKKFKLIDDIYYAKEYCRLYMKKNEELFEFEYKEGEALFYTLSIKRAIELIGSEMVDEGYFDLESVYGYGGFYVNTQEKDFLQRALLEYKKECEKQNIIAEFIRFHPFNKRVNLFSDYFDFFMHDRDTVYLDIGLSKEERWKNYSTNTRNVLRRCEKELLFKQSDDLAHFIELYEATMQKNSADDFYFFDKEYFEALLKLEGVSLYEIIYNGRVIASAFFMFSEEFGHYHLSANDYEYRKHNANYFILDSIFNVAREKGVHYFHLGGGRTNEENDLLLKFKKKFSKTLKPFYIAGKVYNKEIYNRYISMWEEQSSQKIHYFLKYRLELL